MTPGIYYDMPNAAYHGDTSAVGCSGLKAMRRGAAYFYGQYLDPNRPPVEDDESEKPGRLFGNMTHCALFEQDQLHERYRVGTLPTGFKKPKQSKAWKEQKEAAEEQGCVLVDSEQMARVERVRAATLSIPGIAKWFAPGKWRGEVTICAEDGKYPVLRKVRIDNLHFVTERDVVLVDGKTYNSIDEGEFSRQCARMHYDMQAAYYCDTVRLAGLNPLGFLLLGIEDEYPHQSRLFEMDAEAFLNGRRKYEEALALYAQCKASGIWPMPPDTIGTVTLPKYALLENQ